MKKECGLKDCFNCPYADCIVKTEDIKVLEPTDKKRGKKPLTPEERKMRKRERERNYYYRHKEEINKRHIANYYRKKAEREALKAT